MNQHHEVSADHSLQHDSAPHHGLSGNAKESRDGVTWLFAAGLVAIVLGFSLFQVDNWMSANTKGWERAHAAKLRELRTGQAGLVSTVPDPRQIMEQNGLVATRPNGQRDR